MAKQFGIVTTPQGILVAVGTTSTLTRTDDVNESLEKDDIGGVRGIAYHGWSQTVETIMELFAPPDPAALPPVPEPPSLPTPPIIPLRRIMPEIGDILEILDPVRSTANTAQIDVFRVRGVSVEEENGGSPNVINLRLVRYLNGVA